MILPNVRSSFGRAEAGYVVWLLTRGSEAAREREEARLREEGFDAILDDPRTLNAVLASGSGFSTAPQTLVFYVLVRHALLEHGITDRTLADYISAVLISYGKEKRAYRADAEDTAEFNYLVDLVSAAESASGARAVMLHAHIGNFALWLSGLFPDHISARVQRRGAPPIKYYETLGASGYRHAADFNAAASNGLTFLYRSAADSFPGIRIALNSISDRHLFPARGPSIERLLRQIADSAEPTER
ncbi:MAG TPA: hypothetical protein VM100_02635 [Longimicrobiales bacterium]|nr:hypothetical protein [Longimicrobiales bacterium]